MSLRFHIAFYLVTIIQWAQSETYLTSDIIREIFGDGKVQAPLAASQVAAITPYNVSLIDPEYLESMDNYYPAAAEFDGFDWTLTKRVAASSEENFLLSPLGLKLALAILTEAATGATQAELSSVLGFDLDKSQVRKKFASILDSLQTKSSKYILNLGSRIYIGASAEPRQRFAAIAENYYKTEIAKIDFNDPATAANSINSWVANITQGQLPNLVNADDVTGVAVLILTTLYFKGTWLHQFSPNETSVHNFYVTSKSAKEVPFMHVRNKFYYLESNKFDAKIVRMPYLGRKFAMYLVIPNTLTGLTQVFNNLSDLRAELSRLQRHLVHISMPKFQFDYTSILDGVLKELGIRQAFEDTASFPGIARVHDLAFRMKVSKVLQRTGIVNNELGSTAYSATEITLENKFGEEESFYEVIANKPFMFFIQDDATRQLLFTGRVTDPSLVDGSFNYSVESKCRWNTSLFLFLYIDATESISKSISISLVKMILISFVVLLITISSLDCFIGQKPENSRFNFFDTELLRYSSEDKKGNVVVSPASIKSTLAMLLEGANGVTAMEIRNALRLSPDKEEFREQLNEYLSLLKANGPGVTLHNSNAMFISPTVNVRKEFVIMLHKVYLSDIRLVDFREQVAVAKLINSWVSNNTKGLIPALVEPEHIDPTSELLLANALYFKSTWQHAFDPQHTKKGCFRVSGTCQTVAMMELFSVLNYAYIDNLRAHAIELPYEGGRYSMFLLVPADQDGVHSVIRDLPYMSLPQIVKLMDSTDVRLLLPKFTIDYNEDMAGTLRAMKIKSLFSKEGDLSGIFNGSSPQVNNIFHKVHIAVDETGTVAAAASSAMVIPLIENGVQIRVDRPFLFFIRDNKLGLVLFEGKVEEPTAYVEPKPVALKPNETKPNDQKIPDSAAANPNVTATERKFPPNFRRQRLFG
ncbi:uncharacterized protein [Battus philenor]|uniref:uncharacterized protein n=1 Tax=Battus philenor TaxID=42288 RepID=UPI0035D0ED9A